MSLVELNLKPSDRQLRQFGAICIVALPGSRGSGRAIQPPLVGRLLWEC